MVAKKKPGPKTDNPMDTMLRVRVDKITLEKLDDSAKELNTSRSEIIQKGIHKIHDDLKK
ncbi:CopG family transcriptional regulator [Paenibacillus macerans]|uniref:CopG family transcriptional regulator n=1 Tax=Paenibacillus macerans TaxID=44252 RepID=A0A6N8EQF0_PAEMA|nr:CopG family transcriptional regulator [Paenibacillus macerans]MBS5913770.1 CopG family transcriptional regulator [Paenibacillus macerans]MUG22207.1 CopG family transcriptional regulator [Paenibacillus macerans]UMV49010.1 CopG family transcriptional regulator [Paenibacillus macerans]